MANPAIASPNPPHPAFPAKREGRPLAISGGMAGETLFLSLRRENEGGDLHRQGRPILCADRAPRAKGSRPERRGAAAGIGRWAQGAAAPTMQ